MSAQADRVSLRSEHGRHQLVVDEARGTAQLYIENVSRAGDFWLTVSSIDKAATPVGYLRFREVSSHIFELVEVRPADGSLRMRRA